MASFARLIARIGLVLAAANSALAATEVDIETARKLPAVLIASGNPNAAKDILETLLERTPNDPQLLINLSQAERALGRFGPAVSAGRKAFQNSKTPELKFHAARATAQALSSNGQRTRAQIWLRRAGTHAPNERAEAVIRSEYRYVRSRNPVSLSFSFSVSPSDNINNAPSTNRLVLGPFVGVDPRAVPISGYETLVSAGLTYRLPPTETATQQVNLSYAGRRVVLGGEAARIDPNLRNEDFAFDRLSFGWSGRFRSPEAKGIFDASARVFIDQNASEHYQNGQSLTFGYSWQPAPRQTLRIGTGIDLLDRQDVTIRSSETVRLQGNWSIALENKNQFGVELSVADTHSDSVTIANSAQAIRLSYAFGKPILGTYFAFSTEYRRSVFDESSFFLLDKRKDERMTFSASATFVDLEIYGFAPVIDLRFERNRSNISSFDRRGTQVGVSLRSTY